MDPVKALCRYLEGPPRVPQEEFAVRLGVSQSTVSKLKAGALVPTLNSAAAIERETGIPASAWVGLKPRYLRKKRKAA